MVLEELINRVKRKLETKKWNSENLERSIFLYKYMNTEGNRPIDNAIDVSLEEYANGIQGIEANGGEVVVHLKDRMPEKDILDSYERLVRKAISNRFGSSYEVAFIPYEGELNCRLSYRVVTKSEYKALHYKAGEIETVEIDLW
ncbi:hypothetical protein [Streptococcus suis]|nr:hypothetical protein [Streptococcus suis]NQP49568.1 hypothetical protein [Streptococcus suis]NQP57664.1 hypothetical protein [Streptococcus suis]NQP61989.1 hypothetical protein [Streptococcus suis]